MTSPGKQWDQAIESARSVASTPDFKKMRSCRLRLRQVGSRHYFPNRVRRIDLIPPVLREAIRACINGDAPWPLFVSGPPGCGKTCAAFCLLDLAGGFYFSANGLGDILADAKMGRLEYPDSNRVVGVEALWKELESTSLVILDELGTREKITDHAYDGIKTLLDLRENCPLMAISNLDLDGLAQVYDDRIASRLAAGTILTLRGKDMRLER